MALSCSIKFLVSANIYKRQSFFFFGKLHTEVLIVSRMQITVLFALAFFRLVLLLAVSLRPTYPRERNSKKAVW